MCSVVHPVYKKQATLERELYREWKPLLPIVTQEHAHCVIWLGSTFAEPASPQPVISSQAPCWPRILLMPEPLRKGTSVCTLIRTFGEFQVEENIHVPLAALIITTDPATSLLLSTLSPASSSCDHLTLLDSVPFSFRCPSCFHGYIVPACPPIAASPAVS